MTSCLYPVRCGVGLVRAAPALLAAVFLLAPAARARTLREVVTLVDGSTYQGELVEKVPGDHVTLQLATGEIKRFEWSQLASAIDESATGSAPESAPARPHDPASPPEPEFPPEPAPPLPPEPPADLPGPETGRPLVDWPEPDRTPPAMMASRFSLGLVGGSSPLGYGALEAEVYPWDENSFTIGLHAAFGPWGALGPTASGMVTFEWPLAAWIQQGLGVGLTRSFGSAPTAFGAPASPSSVTFFDADCTHFSFFLTRSVMFRTTLGFSFPTSAGCGIGNACGNWSSLGPIILTGALLWNFDTSPGDH